MAKTARGWLRPFLRRFLRIEASSGVALAAATLIALAWAASPARDAYLALRDASLGHVLGLEITPHWLIDDVLMSVFFFVVGLEIRRELSVGELRDRRHAALPAIAALGGMIVPAVLYLSVAHEGATRAGWGIPTATDIAFALGALSLLGRRVPHALRVLLLALAVIDDLGAIVVIAVFYTHGIHVVGLALAAVALLVVLGLQRARVRHVLAYALPALALWLGTLAAGIHPTIAGVVLGLVTPVTGEGDAPSPSERLVTLLHPWVAYAVMPLFALANAGVVLDSVHLEGDALRAAGGIVLGLVVGKPLGIVLACALAVRADVAALPEGLTRRHVVLLGLVGGVGFTMALFVSGLAFDDPALLSASRAAVLAGSALATVLALVHGLAMLPRTAEEAAAQTDRA